MHPLALGGTGNAFTLELWTLVTDTSVNAMIFDFGDGFTAPRIAVGLGLSDRDTERKVEFQIDNAVVGGSAGMISTLENLPQSRWIHVSVTHDGSGEGQILWDGNLKINGALPVAAAQPRAQCFVGKSTRGVEAPLPAIVDDVRVWAEARSPAQIRSSLLLKPSPAEFPALVVAYYLEEDDGVVPLVEATGRDFGSAVAEMSCSSTACRIEIPESFVLCGDGVRGGTEACDDGNENDGDGCSKECTVESGWVCLGGDDLVSTDACDRGAMVFSDGFESGDSGDWAHDPGLFGSWNVNPAYKRGGQYGVQIAYSGEAPVGCPELVADGAFRGGTRPATGTGDVENAEIVAWPAASPGGVGAPEPSGSGFVLQLTGVAAEDRAVYEVKPTPAARQRLWPEGSTADASVTFRVSAWAYAEAGQQGEILWDGHRDLIAFEVLGVGGSTDVIASSPSPPQAGEAEPEGSHRFPRVAGQWERVYVDVTTPPGVEAADFLLSIGAPNGGATTGRVWVSSISVVRWCHGIPAGAAVWLKADSGAPQVDGNGALLWESFSGVPADATAPAADAAPTLVVPDEAALGGSDLPPFLRFDGIDDALLIDDTTVDVQSPMTLFVVDRYTPGSLNSLRQRNVQGTGVSSWAVGLDAGERAARISGEAVWVDAASDATEWAVSTTLVDTEVVSGYFNGKSVGSSTDAALTVVGALSIGGTLGNDGAAFPSAVDVGEIILYRRILTDDERGNVEVYLADKWGIALDADATSEGRMAPIGPSAQRAARAALEDALEAAAEEDADVIVDDYPQVEVTTDLFNSYIMVRRFQTREAGSVAWGRRVISVDLDDSSLFTFSFFLQQQPYYWGVPLWVIITDASDPMSVYDECATTGRKCGGRPNLRICFNGDGEPGQCDEVSSARTGVWVTHTRSIAHSFAAKYGRRGFMPTRVAITFAIYSAAQDAAVLLDDITIFSLGDLSDAAKTCPAIRAESLAVASAWADLATSSLDSWVTKGESASGISVASEDNSIVFAGGSPDGDISDRVSSALFSELFYADRRTVRFQAALGSNMGVDPEVPALGFCGELVNLAPRQDGSGEWAYFFGAEAFAPPPSEPILVTVDDGAGPLTSWSNDRTRVLPADTVPFADRQTYVFYLRVRSRSPDYQGVFFRGGNVGYTLQDVRRTPISGSQDRAPAVWIHPNSLRLHVRIGTTSNWNNGCDPPEGVELNEWTNVALVFEPKLMQVYMNGELRCTWTYGVNEELTVTHGRQIGFVNYQQASGFVDVEDFRWFAESLSEVQLRVIANERSNLDATSVLQPGSDTWAAVRCAIEANRVRVWEDGVLRLDRQINDARTGRSPAAFRVSQNAGEAPVSFSVRNVRVVEQKNPRTIPMFCPGTGNFYQFVEEADVAFAVASSSATDASYVGQDGYLATITSDAENECVAALTGCDSAWISGSLQSDGTWRYSDGPEAGEAFRFTKWDADATPSQPSSGPTETFVAMNGASACLEESDVRMSKWRTCENDCPGIAGYIVEYQASAKHIQEFADASVGASLGTTSEIVAGATGVMWTPSEAEGRARMLTNVLQPDIVTRVASSSDGESNLLFVGDAGVGDDLERFIVADLGAVYPLTRVGATVEAFQAERIVGDYIDIHYAVGAAEPAAESSEWQLWGTIGAKDGIRDVHFPEAYFSRPEPVDVRWLRWRFGCAGGGSGPFRVLALHAQIVDATFARLMKDGVVVGPGENGMNVVVFEGEHLTLKHEKTFALATNADIEELADFIDNQIGPDDYVAMATKEVPLMRLVLFQEPFSSSMTTNDIAQTSVSAPGRGVQQHIPRSTWREAQQHCLLQGAVMCSREDVCRAPGYGYPSGYPWFGWEADALSYIAVADEEDKWLAIGQAFPRSDLCQSYDELHVNGTYPSDEMMSSYKMTWVQCCSAEGRGNPWLVVDEGEQTGTGGPSEDSGSRHPPAWRIDHSRALFYGYAWGNPDRPGYNPSGSWTDERCQAYMGGTLAYLNVDRAYLWNDYTYSVHVHANRAAGVVFRYTDEDNYYRFFADTEANCRVLTRVSGGVATDITPTSIDATALSRIRANSWYEMKVTVLGSLIYVYIDNFLLFEAEDNDETSRLQRGTIGMYGWMADSLYMDTITVQTVTLWADNVHVKEAIRSLGVESTDGVERGSWAMLGRKSAKANLVPVVSDVDGGAVRAVTLFNCVHQTRQLPENARNHSAVPAPVAIHGSSRPRGFYILNGNTDGAFSVDRSTGQLLVNNQNALDFEVNPSFTLEMATREEGYDSGWFRMGSQVGDLSFKEIRHNVNLATASMAVSVKIRAIDGNNEGFVFEGTGAEMQTDESPQETYGGVLFGYSEDRIRLWVPSRHNGASSGYIVNVGNGWGAKYFRGDFVEEAESQHSHVAEVRVTVRPEAAADFDSGWFLLSAQQGSASYASVNHGLGVLPDRVRVLVRATDGPNSHFVFEGMGMPQSDDDNQQAPYGGVVFGYSASEVRIWAPTERYSESERHNGDYSDLGRIILTGEGWAGDKFGQRSVSAEARVLAWMETGDPTFDSDWLDMSSGINPFLEVEHGLGTVPERTQVLIQPKFGKHAAFVFEGTGMVQSSGWHRWRNYGGVVHASNDTVTRLWAPNPDPRTSYFPDHNHGYMVAITDGWGGETNSDTEQVARVRVRSWLFEGGVEEFAEIDVHLTDVQEPPQAVTPRGDIKENTPTDTELGVITSRDGDCPPESVTCPELQYQFLAGNYRDALKIMPDGRVLVDNELALNYEDPDSRIIAIAIRVTDGTLASYAMPRFAVLDDNDKPVVVPGQVVAVEEESPRNTEVGAKVNSTDEDRGQEPFYRIEGGDPLGNFKIGSCDGQIRVEVPPDFETKEFYDLLITVTDDGSPPAKGEGIVRVNIINVNDPPTMEDQTRSVGEHLPAGTLVGSPVDAEDEDGDALSFEILAGDENGVFAVDEGTGQLRIARNGYTDFENELGLNSFVLQMSASDIQYSAEAEVTVVVTDRNDAPVLNSPALSVNENPAVGLSIGFVYATDQDRNDNLTFSLIDVAPPELSMAVELTPDGEVLVTEQGVAVLDFERAQTASLTVFVEDAGGTTGEWPRLNDTEVVTLNIIDVNEAPLLGDGNFSVRENEPAGTFVGVVLSYDEDVDYPPLEDGSLRPPDERGLKFEIQSGDVNRVFRIGGDLGNTGEITVSNSKLLDFEATPTFELVVYCEDDADPPLNGTAIITINLIDTNDPPRIQCADDLGYTWAWEDGGGMDSVTALLPDKSDPESADDSLTFALSPSDASVEQCRTACASTFRCAAFTHYAATYPEESFRDRCLGRSTAVNRFDDATVAGVVRRSDVYAGRKVTVCDEIIFNENPTVNASAGAISVRDDEGDNISIRISDGNFAGSFDFQGVEIGPGLLRGELIPIREISFEDRSKYFLRVVVQDDSADATTSSEMIYVRVLDVNEPPVCSESETFARSVPEGSPAGAALEPAINCWDPDFGDVTFTIDGGNGDGNFELPNPQQGLLVAARDIPVTDGSSVTTYQLSVSVSDGVHSEDLLVTATIQNVNRAPFFEPSVVSAPRAIDENSVDGTSLLPACLASDPDNDPLVYALVNPPLDPDSGTPVFSIDATSAVLSVAPGARLDHERVASYSIPVEVHDVLEGDEAANSITAQQTFVVSVTDLPEPPIVPPEITLHPAENTAPETALGRTFSAVDYDDDGVLLEPTVRSAVGRGPGGGDRTSLFTASRIGAGTDPTIHILQLAVTRDELNFEAPDGVTVYDVFVDVTDGTFTREIHVTVVVVDVPEPPVFAQNVSLSLRESDRGHPAGTVVGSVPASDPDFNTTLHFTIAENFRVAGQDAFFVSPEGEAVLSVVPGTRIDFEDLGTMQVTLMVRDSTDSATWLTGTTVVRIEIEDVNDISVSRVVRLEGDNDLPADDLSTTGGEGILLIGTNFGMTTSFYSRTGETERAIPSVQYGGVDGTRYAARDCAVAPELDPSGAGNTVLRCESIAGVGAGLRLRVAISGWEYLSPSFVTVSYAKPQLFAIGDGAQNVNTRGGSTFSLSGANFGGGDPVVVSYNIPGVTPEYTAAECIVTEPHVQVSCQMVAGVGADHLWTLRVGGQSSQATQLTSSYRAPTISSIVIDADSSVPLRAGDEGAVDPNHRMATDGTTGVQVTGDFFGPDASGAVVLRAAYGPTGLEYFVSCALVVPHTGLRCTTAPGIGNDFHWTVAIAGQTSDLSVATTSYAAPEFASFQPISGPGAQNGSTVGSQFVYASGSNFGPLQLPASLFAEYVVRYGDAAAAGNLVSGLEYTARNCTSFAPEYHRVQCVTAPGTGRNHSWAVGTRVCSSAQSHCRTQWSEMVHAQTAYGSPSIGAIRGTGAVSGTPGGEVVVISGANFGYDDDKIDLVEYRGVRSGSADAESGDDVEDFDHLYNIFRPQVGQAGSCRITKAHEEITCLTEPGAGKDLLWRIIIDSQVSVNPSYQYLAPRVLSISGPGAINADTRGGQLVVLAGENFGPADERYSLEVTYGPSGRGYLAKDCVVSVPHFEITCYTQPGVGSALQWIVTVQGQASMTGLQLDGSMSPTTSYAPPRIDMLRPLSQIDPLHGHRTEGGVRMTLEGDFFGPPGADSWVMFGETPTRCGAAVGGGATACARIIAQDHSRIVFVTPPGQGALLPVVVWTGATLSNTARYNYSVPYISRLVVYERRPGESVNTTRVAIYGSNFGVAGTIDARTQADDLDGPPLTVLDNGAGFLTHTEGFAEIVATAGKLRVIAGGQVSNVKTFSQASPNITSWYAADWDQNPGGDEPQDRGVPGATVGQTAGGFLFVLWARNIGRVSTFPTPTVEVLVGGRLCAPRPLTSILDSENNLIPDPSVYTLSEGGDNIDFGRIVCVSPEGQGRQLPVVVKHIGQDDTSEPVYFDFNPPSALAFAVGGRSSQVLDGASTGQTVTITGADLGFEATIHLADLRNDFSFNLDAHFIEPHRTCTFEVPYWQGSDLVVALDVSGQRSSSNLTLSYTEPEFTVVADASERPTSGGTAFVLVGSGFGRKYLPRMDEFGDFVDTDVILGFVTVGDRVTDCPEWSDTRITCFSPPGEGALESIVVASGGQESARSRDRVFAYSPPELIVSEGDGPWIANTSGLVEVSGNNTRARTTLVLSGKNFGTRGAVMFGSFFEIETEHADVLSWGHERIEIFVPEYSGRGHYVRVRAGSLDAGGQITPANDDAVFSYNPPWIAEISPRVAPTDGCFQWESITRDNIGADASGRPQRPCCQPALITLNGANFGVRVEDADITINGVGIGESCEAVSAEYRGSPFHLRRSGAPHIKTGVLCNPRCKDAEFQIANRELCDTSDCCHYGYPEELWDTGSCRCAVPPRPCILSIEHETIRIRPPSGFGLDRELVVLVNGQTNRDAPAGSSDTELGGPRESFDFAAPEVRTVTPTPYNADGQALEIQGANFGDSSVSDNVTVVVDETDCANALWQLDARGEVAGGLPFITCDAQRDTVGAKSASVIVGGVNGIVEELDQRFVSVCTPDFYGRPGELCLPCPEGAQCYGSESDPTSIAGWWMEYLIPNSDSWLAKCPEERKNRTQCQNFIPCEPLKACGGLNNCTEGYRGVRCALCAQGYYRMDGECIECPDNPWILIAAGLFGITCACVMGYILNRKSVNMGVLAILIDYVQVLAIFKRAKVQWPQAIKDLFTLLSVFNFNIELTAPECSIPDLSYQAKWLFMEGLPIGGFCMMLALHVVLWCWKRCIKGQSAKNARSHVGTLYSTSLTMMYFLYLLLTRTTFDVFNCAPTTPDDGAPHGYLQAVFEPCYEEGGVHLFLLPFAVCTLLAYTVAYPSYVFWVLYKNRRLAEEDQLLRAMDTGDRPSTNPNAFEFRLRYHRLYYNYKPHKVYWIVAVMGRKAAITVTSLMFLKNPTFQLAMALLVLFAAFALQARHQPYMSNVERQDVLRGYEDLSDQKPHLRRMFERVTELRERVGRQVTKLSDRNPDDVNLGEAAASYIHNYNTVESTMLSSSVLVCLAGIMFQSGRFDDAYFDTQRDVITFVVIFVVAASLVYGWGVFFYDIIITVKPDCCQDTSKEAAKRRAKEAKLALAVQDATFAMSGAAAPTGAGASATGSAMQQNPMFDARVQKIDGTQLPRANPSQEQWNHIRTAYQTLVSTRDRLKAAAAASASRRGKARRGSMMDTLRSLAGGSGNRRPPRSHHVRLQSPTADGAAGMPQRDEAAIGTDEVPPPAAPTGPRPKRGPARPKRKKKGKKRFSAMAADEGVDAGL